MPFPAAKLFSVALRQLSKPMAACLQKTAQGNEYFKGACVSMATRYHIMEQRIINRFYDKDGKNEFIPKLNEENAVKLGATIMGEAFIFGVADEKLRIQLVGGDGLLLCDAAFALVFEYRRSSLKEAAKEKQLQERLLTLEAQIVQLQEENDRMLKRMFPDEKHVRSSIDISYDPQGWVSWLISSFKDLAQTNERD